MYIEFTAKKNYYTVKKNQLGYKSCNTDFFYLYHYFNCGIVGHLNRFK